MNRHILIVGVIALGAVAGCKEEPPAPAPAATAKAAAVQYADTDLAVEADFEEEAESQITTANYKTELTELEKEVDKP